MACCQFSDRSLKSIGSLGAPACAIQGRCVRSVLGPARPFVLRWVERAVLSGREAATHRGPCLFPSDLCPADTQTSRSARRSSAWRAVCAQPRWCRSCWSARFFSCWRQQAHWLRTPWRCRQVRVRWLGQCTAQMERTCISGGHVAQLNGAANQRCEHHQRSRTAQWAQSTSLVASL